MSVNDQQSLVAWKCRVRVLGEASERHRNKFPTRMGVCLRTLDAEGDQASGDKAHFYCPSQLNDADFQTIHIQPMTYRVTKKT